MRNNITAIALIGAPALTIGCVPNPQQKACINFESPFVVGQEFGNPAGNTPGDVVMASNGITVSVELFTLTNGSQTFGVAHIDNLLVPNGSGQSLRSNNISLLFDFKGVGFPVSKVVLGFDDFGGTENIAVNGAPTPPVLELSSQPLPPSLGGVAAKTTVVSVPVSVDNPAVSHRYGSLELSGPIQSILLGGQELWIDEVCAER